MFKVKSLIGTRVTVEYDDQNENFKPLLPRSGIITRQILAEHDVKDWFLVKLDEPFDFKIGESGALSFDKVHCEKILIRSRWKGHRIGETSPTSVFILLIRDETLLDTEPISVEKFYHVAWGMCQADQVKWSS